MFDLRALTRSSMAAAAVFAGVLVTPFLWIVHRAPETFEGGLLLSGRGWLATHTFALGAAYPPGIPLIFAGIEFLGGPLSPFQAVLFQAVFFIVGALAWWKLIGYFFENPKHRWITYGCSLVNPYFLWLVLTSKDTAFEWFSTTIFFLALFGLVRSTPQDRKNGWRILTIIILFSLGISVRVVLVPILLGVLLVAFWITPTHRRSLGNAAMGCLFVIALFLSYQRATYGYSGLSTTFGYNFYLGQHPLYEYTHPQFDIDVFLAREIPSMISNEYSAAGSDTLQKLAIAEIKADPIRFVGISVRKTIWHWFNFEKIPNLSANTRIIHQEGARLEIATDPIRSVPSLVYSLYKLFYIPAFFLSIFFWIKRRGWRDRVTLFLVPLLVLWPVVVLTFPDTRFKIIAEVLAVAFIVHELVRAHELHRAFSCDIYEL